MKDRFIMDEDEELSKQLGEIFLTSKGRVSFHCTLCKEAYCGFESFQDHLNKDHLNKDHIMTNFKLEVKAEMVPETIMIQPDFQIESNDDESEHEDLLAIPVDEIKSEDGLLPKNLTSKNATQISIPMEVRQVTKRAVYKKQTVSEEDRKHKCPICDYAFKDKNNLNRHLKRHSNERNHVCPHCDKRFYSSSELNTHIKTHTKERPILCTECGKTFTTASKLGDHLKRHRGQRDYRCQHPGCQKAFYNSVYLNNHMLCHSNERHLKCSTCGAAFKQKTAFKNHMKLHENKKEYKCEICGAEFNQIAGKFSHMKTVHKAI